MGVTAQTTDDIASKFCTKCGKPLQPGAPFCAYCATPVAGSQNPQPKTVSAPAPTPTPPISGQPKVGRRVVWIVGVIVVVIVIVLVALATIPVAQRASYQTQILTPSGSLFGCGTSEGAGQTFPSGKTVHVSWKTTPSEDVTVTVVGLQTESVVFSGSGASGSGAFYSLGDYYVFGTGNCGSQAVSVSITAYYNFNAPLL